jgi:hypothetical protein
MAAACLPISKAGGVMVVKEGFNNGIQTLINLFPLSGDLVGLYFLMLLWLTTAPNLLRTFIVNIKLSTQSIFL